MRLFRRRRDPLADLGDGVWRRLHDRFRRAVDRFHQMLEAVPPGPTRDALEADGARLAEMLDDVRDTCRAAERHWHSSGLDIPADGSPLHREISRAATAVAQAAEAAAMARVCVEAGDLEGGSSWATAARRAVDHAHRGIRAGLTGLPEDG